MLNKERGLFEKTEIVGSVLIINWGNKSFIEDAKEMALYKKYSHYSWYSW